MLQSQGPIIVRVVEQPVKATSLADVIFGAVGLVGILLIAAAVLGVILGGGLIALRKWRQRHGMDPDPVSENPFRVTPT